MGKIIFNKFKQTILTAIKAGREQGYFMGQIFTIDNSSININGQVICMTELEV